MPVIETTNKIIKICLKLHEGPRWGYSNPRNYVKSHFYGKFPGFSEPSEVKNPCGE